MSGLRIINGVKAVDIEGLWLKVTEDGRSWREGLDDWFPSSKSAESILKAIAREEAITIIKSGFLPPDAAKPAAIRTDTAADRIKALILASDKSYTARELSEECNCCRRVTDDAIETHCNDKIIVRGKDTRSKNKGRPAKTWRRKYHNR